MVILSTLPSELIAEVATHLDYHDAQKLRLACRRIDKAIQHIALSRLKLQLPQTYGNYYRSRIPFQQIQAYTTPGHTLGFNFVRHLTIDRICIDLWGTKPSLDHIKVNPRHISVVESSGAEPFRLHALKCLFANLLLGDGLKNLETVKWHVRKCLIHSPEDPDDGFPLTDKNECQGLLEMFARLLTSRGPLHRLEIMADDDSILKCHRNGLPCIPPCKEFVLTGLSDTSSSDGTADLDYTWVDKIIAECPGLESIDVDCRFDERRFARHFSGSSSPDSAVNRTQYTSLFLEPGAYQMPHNVINHFRYLQKIDVGSARIGEEDDFQSGIDSLWSLLAAERIYAVDIGLFLGVAQSGWVNYLASYPRSSLKSLELWTYYDEEPVCLPGVAEDFFVRGFPVIASGLERFSIDTFHLNEWCVKPETFLVLKRCTSLKEVSMSMDTEYTGDSFRDMVYSTFTRQHRQLETVSITEIFNHHEETPELRYKQYDLEFAGPCLKVIWGGSCNLHCS